MTEDEKRHILRISEALKAVLVSHQPTNEAAALSILSLCIELGKDHGIELYDLIIDTLLAKRFIAQGDV